MTETLKCPYCGNKVFTTKEGVIVPHYIRKGTETEHCNGSGKKVRSWKDGK